MSQFNTSPNSELTIVGDPFLIDARASREREFTISIDFRDGKVDLGWKERVDGGATVELPDDSGTGIDGDDTPEPSGGDAGDGDGSEGPTSEN